MKARKREIEKINNPVAEFPEKVDKLMIAIDKVNCTDKTIQIFIFSIFLVVQE
jgi:hypothetical protein